MPFVGGLFWFNLRAGVADSVPLDPEDTDEVLDALEKRDAAAAIYPLKPIPQIIWPTQAFWKAWNRFAGRRTPYEIGLAEIMLCTFIEVPCFLLAWFVSPHERNLWRGLLVWAAVDLVILGIYYFVRFGIELGVTTWRKTRMQRTDIAVAEVKKQNASDVK
jgi:hypothetical protein